MIKNISRNAFTLLEMLAAVTIVLILVTTIYPVLEKTTPRAERIVCENNLRNLRVAFAGVAVEGWPQPPKEIPRGSLEEQKWWLDKSIKDLGLTEKTWQCPTLRRLFQSTKPENRPLIHYVPTPFSAAPNRANLWTQMPWFMEIGDPHGCGNLMIRQNGSVEPAHSSQ